MFAAAYSASRPVLWRLLIAQAALMHILVDLVDRDRPTATIGRILPGNIADFAPGSDRQFDAEVGAVERYLAARLQGSGLAVVDSRAPASA
jgi:hypothetical protein